MLIVVAKYVCSPYSIRKLVFAVYFAHLNIAVPHELILGKAKEDIQPFDSVL